MSNDEIKVGDLVEHRTSGESGIVTSIEAEKRTVILSLGFGEKRSVRVPIAALRRVNERDD